MIEQSLDCGTSERGLRSIHNPAAYYTTVRTACGSRDVPLASAPDVWARFTFVTPNLCSDMHSCSVSIGDTWPQGFLPQVFASTAYKAGKTAVFLTCDEDDRSHSNRVASLVMAPSVPAGRTSSSMFNHYSMLRTTE